MTGPVDCLLIGHNQIPFVEYEKTLRRMGEDSGAYRDLSNNTIRVNNRTWNPADLLNLLGATRDGPAVEPIRGVEVFSAAIAYLYTYLTRRDLKVDYVNSFQDEKGVLAEKLRGGDVRSVAILTTLYITAFPVIEIIDFVRRHNRDARIIVGGPFVTTKARTLEREQLDYLFRSVGADIYVNSSQGEATLARLVEAIRAGTDVSDIENIHFATPRGYRATPVLAEDNPIQDNPVDWSLFSGGSLPKFVNVRTAISCPFTCSFCGFPEHAGKYQYATVERVERELDLLAGHHPTVRNVTFTDDTFNVPLTRFKQMLRMMIKNDYPFTWSSFFRCQYADAEAVELMAESKCESVFLGLESADERILENMNKAATVEQFRRGIDLLRGHGIVSFANFVVGFPGETEETVGETIDFINEGGIDFYRAQAWYCEHITPVWREREKYDLHGESFEWRHSTMDSATAAAMVNRIILSVTNSTRLPQYYFDYDNVMQLTHKGLTLDDVKRFLRSFDGGVQEKLRDPSSREPSVRTLQAIMGSLGRQPEAPVAAHAVSMDDAGFDF